MLVLVCAGSLLKLAAPENPWGLSYRAGTVQPLAPALSTYCESRRSTRLVIVDVADDLYAPALPIQVRYLIMSPIRMRGAYGMPFDQMGVIVTADEFNNLEKLRPAFRDRLRQWGIDSDEPIATLITATSPEELAGIVRAHPLDDFLIPERYRSSLTDSGHNVSPAARGYFFLLSRTKFDVDAAPPWTCRM